MLSRAGLLPTLWTVAPPSSSVHGNSPGQSTRAGCHVLLQGIFPTQGWNPGLPHRRHILYPLSHQGSPLEPYFKPKSPPCPVIVNHSIPSAKSLYHRRPRLPISRAWNRTEASPAASPHHQHTHRLPPAACAHPGRPRLRRPQPLPSLDHQTHDQLLFLFFLPYELGAKACARGSR